MPRLSRQVKGFDERSKIVASEPHDAGAPGQAAAHGLDQQQLAGLDAAVVDRLAPRPAGSRRPRCWRARRRWRSPGPRRCRRRRATPSRMRWLAWWGMNQSTSASVDAGARRRRLDRLGDVDHRVAEHLVALHAQLADRAGGRGAAVDVEQILLGPVGSAGRSPACRGRRRRPCPRPAPAPPRRRRRRTARRCRGRSSPSAGSWSRRRSPGRTWTEPAGDEAVGDRQRVDEAGADRLDVEGDADRRAQLALDDGGGGRERSGRAWWWRRRSGRRRPACGRPPPGPCAAAVAARSEVASPSARRGGAGGCRCARRSRRRWCRRPWPGRRW